MSAGTLPLGKQCSGHVRAQRTRSKCRHCFYGPWTTTPSGWAVPSAADPFRGGDASPAGPGPFGRMRRVKRARLPGRFPPGIENSGTGGSFTGRTDYRISSNAPLSPTIFSYLPRSSNLGAAPSARPSHPSSSQISPLTSHPFFRICRRERSFRGGQPSRRGVLTKDR